jgi:hypothetical protein
MDNVQKHNTCINVPSSQIFRSYLQRWDVFLQHYCITRYRCVHFSFALILIDPSLTWHAETCVHSAPERFLLSQSIICRVHNRKRSAAHYDINFVYSKLARWALCVKDVNYTWLEGKRNSFHGCEENSEHCLYCLMMHSSIPIHEMRQIIC